MREALLIQLIVQLIKTSILKTFTEQNGHEEQMVSLFHKVLRYIFCHHKGTYSIIFDTHELAVHSVTILGTISASEREKEERWQREGKTEILKSEGWIR